MPDNLSDAETIQYAEPYRDTSKKNNNEIYRRKAKKKAIKILTKLLLCNKIKLKRKVDKEISASDISDTKTIQYAERYETPVRKIKYREEKPRRKL